MSWLLRPENRWWTVLLMLATIAVYTPQLGGTWVWDDHAVLENNPRLFQPWGYLTHDVYTALSNHPGDIYRPLCYLSYLLDQSIAVGPLSAKIGNLVLHVAAALLVAAVARELGASDRWALVGAALFALHPASSEPIAYAVCRHITVPTVLALGAVMAYLRRHDALAGALLAITPFANEPWVLAPLFLAAWMIGARRWSWTAIAICVAGLGAYLAVREALGLSFFHQGASIPGALLPALGGFARRGLELVLVPDTADVLPPMRPDPMAGAIVAGLAVVLALALRGRPLVAAVLAPCFIMLPCALSADLGGLVADRYYYVGMACTVGIGGALAAARWLPARTSGFVALVALALGFGTWVRAHDWTDDVALFSAAVRHGHPRGEFYLGSYFQEHGDCGTAVAHYRAAVAADQRAADNLQACLIALGQLDEALSLAPRVTGPSAWHQGPFLNTARALVMRNDLDAARRYVVDATTRFPTEIGGWVMLGNIEGMRGDLDAADEAFERALQIDPDDAEAKAGKDQVATAREAPM